jgi:hypothetical protein
MQCTLYQLLLLTPSVDSRRYATFQAQQQNSMYAELSITKVLACSVLMLSSWAAHAIGGH